VNYIASMQKMVPRGHKEWDTERMRFDGIRSNVVSISSGCKSAA